MDRAVPDPWPRTSIVIPARDGEAASRRECEAVHPKASTLIRLLDLLPHPEGGYYREVFRSVRVVRANDSAKQRASITAIYFHLVAGQYSRWHRITSDEVWHYYEGDPLELI